MSASHVGEASLAAADPGAVPICRAIRSRSLASRSARLFSDVRLAALQPVEHRGLDRVGPILQRLLAALIWSPICSCTDRCSR